MTITDKRFCNSRKGLVITAVVIPWKERRTHFFCISTLRLIGDEVLANGTGSSIPVKRHGAVGNIPNPQFSRRWHGHCTWVKSSVSLSKMTEFVLKHWNDRLVTNMWLPAWSVVRWLILHGGQIGKACRPCWGATSPAGRRLCRRPLWSGSGPNQTNNTGWEGKQMRGTPRWLGNMVRRNTGAHLLHLGLPHWGWHLMKKWWWCSLGRVSSWFSHPSVADNVSLYFFLLPCCWVTRQTLVSL